METGFSGVRVTYKGDDRFTGRYSGIDYEFRKGTVAVLPQEAVSHIFGYGLGKEGKIKAFSRWGLIRDDSQYDDVVESFLGQYQFDEVTASFQEVLPADEPFSNDASPLGAGVGEGESEDPPEPTE